jgi:pilus assembly protein Flp/PilA
MAAALIAIQSWISSRYRSEDRGASLVEYALLIALILVVCVIAVRVLGTQASTSFSSTGNGFGAN